MSNGTPQINHATHSSRQNPMEKSKHMTSSLPILHVYAEIHYRDGWTGRSEIHLTIVFEKDTIIPPLLDVKISNRHQKELFCGTFKLKPLRLKKYIKNSHPKRHVAITMSELQFSQIENDPGIKITFSWDDCQSVHSFQV